MSKELSLTPTPEELNVYQIMAKKAAESQFFQKIGGEAGLLSIMLMARELGLPPLQSVMGGMSVIQGKVEVSPRMMNTMIRKAGHRLDIIDASDTKCIIKGTRNDTKETYECSYSLEDAKKAGLVRSGGGWEKYSSDMLFARCLSRLARRLFADVISSAYVQGEISDGEYVEQSDKAQSYGNTEQLSRLQSVTDSKKEQVVEEVAVVKEAVITEEEFLEKIHEKYPDVNLGLMHGYISKIETEKSVKGYQIMQQALNSALTSRFMKGYESWMNAQLETDEATDEALRK